MRPNSGKRRGETVLGGNFHMEGVGVMCEMS
jgi:hypothetical protein